MACLSPDLSLRERTPPCHCEERTHFVIARSVATWQSRGLNDVPFGNEIATLRSQ